MARAKKPSGDPRPPGAGEEGGLGFVSDQRGARPEPDERHVRVPDPDAQGIPVHTPLRTPFEQQRDDPQPPSDPEQAGDTDDEC